MTDNAIIKSVPAFYRGRDVRLSGRGLGDNPYPPCTDEWCDWRFGWHQAFNRDLTLFTDTGNRIHLVQA